MKSDLHNKLLILLILLIAGLDLFLVAGHAENTTQNPALELQTLQNPLTPKNPPAAALQSQEPEAKSVPFTTQAPLGYWTKEPWADFAEEACAYMAFKWGTNAEMPDKDETAANLEAIGDWEEEHFGSSKLTDIPQTLQILTKALGYSKATMSEDSSEANLKSLLDSGAIVLLPVRGKILDNRYYGDPAPEFHMILIYDYNEEGFLANDPGTSRGEATLYSVEKTLEALQDLNGEKRFIVVTH